jgi:nucleoside-diphosphate-sugar epimerase
MAKRKIKNILVTGSVGQIGSELTLELRKKYGSGQVVACGRKTKPSQALLESGPFEWLDVADAKLLAGACKKHHIDTIVNMAAILSATGEKNPKVSGELLCD